MCKCRMRKFETRCILTKEMQNRKEKVSGLTTGLIVSRRACALNSVCLLPFQIEVHAIIGGG